ncbi:class I tRNA ligase family protein, partial [Candidatus Saccharibacteria bacterium]|nr:class I tRNA ligase family protein [Candidatus Saccharibacteria bacterium]
IRHPYPHCHRCGTRLMYRAHPSWFFDVQGQKQLMLEKNSEQINWFPEHLKHGRFEKNIEQAPDWNLSRDRFWATAMPVWEGVDQNGEKRQIVVGSYAELKELSGVELEDYHRPWVDAIEFDKDGVHYKRIEKVLDGWFESGSMPFAQFHYPFENKEKFEANFPGDFIVEYIGQVRAWFYYMHVVSVGLFGESSFRNVITTGTLAGNDGRKMSKSYGNYTDPNELMDKFSADSLRFLLMSSPVLSGEDFSLQDKDVGDVARKLSMIWNMYDFFTMYAEVDGWDFDSTKPFSLNPDDLTNSLDKWVVSRVHQLNEHVTKHMDEYNLPVAMSEFLPFIEDASNWFVRRSRRRFWKSEDDSDKAEAYRTLHYVLMKLSVILAPFTPFLAEELYQKLGGSSDSVHLLDWPIQYTVDQQILDEMETVRDYVNKALSLRASERVKIRQPLASVTVPAIGKVVNFEDILKEELNVKNVIQGDELALDFVITPELRREGLMREIIRHVQAARKDAGLNVDDRIYLSLSSDGSELQQAIAEHKDTIATETLAIDLTTKTYAYATVATVDTIELRLSLEKAA